MKIDIKHPEILGMEKYEPTAHNRVFVDLKLDRVCVLLDFNQAIVLSFNDYRDD